MYFVSSLCLPAALLFSTLLPPAPHLTSPLVLTLQASGGSGGSDITAFVDGVEIIDAVTGRAVSGAVPNAGFELPAQPGHVYNPAGGTWTFTSRAGVARNGSEFGSPAAPEGAQVAFLQSVNADSGYLQQELPTLPPGVYQVRLRVAQRACCYGTFDQGVRVWVDQTLLGTIVPDRDGQFHLYTSSSFTLTQPTRRPSPAAFPPVRPSRR